MSRSYNGHSDLELRGTRQAVIILPGLPFFSRFAMRKLQNSFAMHAIELGLPIAGVTPLVPRDRQAAGEYSLASNPHPTTVHMLLLHGGKGRAYLSESSGSGLAAFGYNLLCCCTFVSRAIGDSHVPPRTSGALWTALGHPCRGRVRSLSVQKARGGVWSWYVHTVSIILATFTTT